MHVYALPKDASLISETCSEAKGHIACNYASFTTIKTCWSNGALKDICTSDRELGGTRELTASHGPLLESRVS